MRKTLLAAALSLTPLAATASPNVLLVIADDMGVDASPCHAQGSNMVRMPTLEALCDTGRVYDNAHAYPTCSPTRASILTGLYASRTGVGSAGAGLATNTPSLFDRLNQQGTYASAVVGKWHLSESRRDLNHPSKLGVPTYYGIPSGGVQDYEDWRVVENGRASISSTYVTKAITDYAINWIDDQNKPWFLWLAYTAPHTPFHAPPSDLHSFGTLSENASTIRKDPRKHYFASLEALDTELGRLLDSLSPAERRDTVVIFTGDNGTTRQVTRRLNTQRDAKGTIYNGGTHVPMVITGPGVSKGRTEDPVQVTDLFDTILALTGARGQTADSHDLTPTFTGRSTTRDAAYIEHFSSRSGRGKPVYGWSIISNDYSLIAAEDAPMELYASSDQKQRKNLISKAQSEAEKLVALRKDYLN
ncbi:MAG: sulfatase-like hydrolase/transferase [Cognatishimia activa]